MQVLREPMQGSLLPHLPHFWTTVRGLISMALLQKGHQTRVRITLPRLLPHPLVSNPGSQVVLKMCDP
jgi:hypothetical protein